MKNLFIGIIVVIFLFTAWFGIGTIVSEIFGGIKHYSSEDIF